MLFIRIRVVPVRIGKTIATLFASLGFLLSPVAWSRQQHTPDSETSASASGPQQDQRQTGSVSGKIVDQSGTDIAGAVIKLTQEGKPSELEASSDEDGRFVFFKVDPGEFHLTISFPGLASQHFSGTVRPGEHYATPLIMLVIATQVTEIRVGVPPEELATAQIKEQEKQRVLGIVPNFYVSYLPDAAPLTPKHKFELAWKSASDPVTLVGVGVLAGIDQAGDRWSAYGQGAQGYAKRYGATYANVFAATFVGGAVMPSLLKQDPRYFYKGTGSKRSRVLYAIATSVICKGDNGHWQANYSGILGGLAAGGISNLYYPAKNRDGAELTFENALVGIGETAGVNLLQEFVIRKLTRNVPNQGSASP